MKVSEKSLELNVGAELLMMLRCVGGMPKTYLRGLTQREESQEGVDFFAQLHPSARLFAFQFKAPRKGDEFPPYKYTLKREQHDLLYALAQSRPMSVFYVFPFYVTEDKLRREVPLLMRDTWFADIANMDSAQAFGTQSSKTVRCRPWSVLINPEFQLRNFIRERIPNDTREAGIPPGEFAEWHLKFRKHLSSGAKRRNPWLARGLRIAIWHETDDIGQDVDTARG